MNKLVSGLLVTILLITSTTFSQQRFSLDEVVALAKQNSIQAFIAKTRRENLFWNYRSYLSQYRPQLSLQGTLPNFTRAFDPVRQPDGSTEFQPVNINNSNLSLLLEQNIGLTGTNIFILSDVASFSDFDNSITRFNSTPLQIGISQPLFNFNELAWDRKIEPLRFEESKRSFVEDQEEIALQTTNLFFNLLLQQVNLEISQKNFGNNDTIFKIAEGRYNLGKIAENELLQLELNLMNSRQAMANARLNAQSALLELKNYIGLQEDADLILDLPATIPNLIISEEVALQYAMDNRSDVIQFRRQQIEADAEVAQARGNAGLNANVFATFGLTNRADEFGTLYQNPQDQQAIRAGFTIPILDWERRKSSVKRAEANAQLINYTVEQERMNFEQEILTQVRTFSVLNDQVEIAQRSDEIADKSYEIAKSRFLIGKISITDLNDALEKKDQAKRSYISALRDYWTAYYQLRLLTLYDFDENQLLYEPEEN